MSEIEIQPADIEARRRALRLLVVAAVVGAAAIWLVQNRLDDALQPATGEPNPLAAGATILGVGLVLGAALVAISLWLVSLGRRIESARRFPPPGMQVIQDTVVRRGSDAVRLAYLLYGGAAVLFVGGITIPFQIWRLLESVRPS